METPSFITRLPVVFANSIPKCGTHLLKQIVHGIPYLNKTLQVIQETDYYHTLNQAQPGTVVVGHLWHTEKLRQFLNAKRIRSFFIYRDPRDMAISYAFYVTKLPTHPLHRYFREYLKTDEERIMKMITGFVESVEIANRYLHGNRGIANIREQYLPFLGWLQDADTCPVRFEDLVAEQGTRTKRLYRMVDFLWDDLQMLGLSKRAIVEAMEKNINPSASPTFRRGKAGEWRRYFTEQHKCKFKEVAGQLLMELGYEKDGRW